MYKWPSDKLTGLTNHQGNARKTRMGNCFTLVIMAITRKGTRQQQVVTRMWRKENCSTLLMGM
jgi:hypothetical protein